MNSKDTGNIVEAKTLLFFLENYITVSQPFGNNARYDFIVDINNKLYRIQCKHGRLENGCIAADASNYSDGKEKRHYFGEADFFAIYADFTKKLYLVPIVSQTPTSKLALRVFPTKKKYTKKIWIAENFEAYKILNLILNNQPLPIPSQAAANS